MNKLIATSGWFTINDALLELDKLMIASESQGMRGEILDFQVVTTQLGPDLRQEMYSVVALVKFTKE